jgi:hypothetical protein
VDVRIFFVEKSVRLTFMIGFHYSAFIMSIAAARMYRGLSDYLGRTDIFHSTHVLPASRQPNSRPFGNFVAPPSSDIVIISASGGMQSDAQVSDTGSLTVGSSDNAEKAASGGDEIVWIV